MTLRAPRRISSGGHSNIGVGLVCFRHNSPFYSKRTLHFAPGFGGSPCPFGPQSRHTGLNKIWGRLYSVSSSGFFLYS